MATPRFDPAALFEHLPNAIMVLDRALRYVAANPAYLRVTGAHRDDVIGAHVFAAFPNDPADPNSANRAILQASFDRVLATGAPDELAAVRYRVARVPGGPLEERLWSARHTPILDDAGAVAFIIQETAEVTHLAGTDLAGPLASTVLDRAERVQAVASNLDAELRDLRQMFAQAPGFMCFLRGPTHVFAIVNQAYRQLVGHRDVVGMAVADAIPEVIDQGFIRLLDDVFTTGREFIGKQVPIQLQRTPGGALESCLLDFVYQPIRDGAGDIAGIFVQGQDVTAAHLAELRQRFLIEAIPVQVWTAAPDGALDFVSERVVAYFQSTQAEILGSGWQAVIHPDDLAVCVERWVRSLASGEPYEVEFRLRRGDGAYRWHLGRANAERGIDGSIVRWFGTNTDIHEAKVVLAELRARSEYEQRLIGIVSHDLRNPLGAVSLAATVLRERSQLDEIGQRTVARIARSADRANRLITDLLQFAAARVQFSIPINPQPTNLREIVEQVVDELQSGHPTRIVRVGHAGDEDGHWDADRIAQVFSNLVGNALQHAPPDAPIIVESRIDGDAAIFAVRNDGPPIPEGELHALFEPFKRGGSAVAGGGSVGLGLYIAREVVVAHGGTIEVQSQLATGTCFTVRLPRFVAPAARL